MQKAFTLIEILVTLAIILLLILVVLPEFRQLRNSQLLNSSVEEVVSAINKASSNTLASLDSSVYGVHFDSNQMIIFKGEVFDDKALDNEIIQMPNSVTISSISFGGTTNFYFNRLTNRPSATGSATLSVSSLSKIISIDATGTVSVN